MDTFNQTLVIANGAAVSNSIYAESYALVGLVTPAFTATTAKLFFETTESGPSVADASATWYPVYNQSGTRFSATVSASAAYRIQFDSPAAGVVRQLGRFRVRAVTSGDVDVNQTGDKTIYPKFARA